VSVAVQVTLVVPFGKTVPEGGEQVTITPGQLSVAVAAKVTTAEQRPGSFPTVISAGQVICGGSVSLTVTPKVQDVPVALVQVTVVVPTGKYVPEGGSQVTVPHPPVVVGME